MSKGNPQGILLIGLLVVAGMAVIGWATPAQSSAVKNTPYLFFDAQGNPSTTLTGVQGSGQSSPLNTVTVSTRPSSSNQLLHAGTTYCTGVTSAAWSPTVSGDNVILLGQIAALNVNVTTQLYSFTFVIGANGVVPSTTFGTGSCGSLTGATTLASSYQVPLANVSYPIALTNTGSRTTGTYYAWINVSPVTTNVKASFLEAAFAQLTLMDLSNTKAPPAGTPGVTVNQGTWMYPSATTELFGSTNWRIPIKLQTPIITARIFATVTTPALWVGIQDTTARMWVQYSTNGGGAWNDLCGSPINDPATTRSIDVTVTGLQVSGFCTIVAGALGDVLLRAVGDGGDDATTAIFNIVGVEFSV